MATLPLTEIFGVLAAEADVLSDLTARAAAALARTLEEAADLATPELMRDAQAIDGLEQHVAGLRAYLETLAQGAPDGVLLDVAGATGRLSLAAQAARLSGRDGAALPAAELELF